MSLFGQREYPRIFIAREIDESLRYPPEPIKPKKPTPPSLSIPVKYPNLAESLKFCGIGLIGSLAIGLVIHYVSNWQIILILVLFVLCAICGTCATIDSLMQSRTYDKRINAYKEAQNKYEQELKQFEEQHKVYLEGIKILKERFKTPSDVLDYRISQREKFLQEFKSKERHESFYELGFSNPHKGRAEYFFKNYIENAKLKGLISHDFDFLYDTSVMTFSVYGIKEWFFYPDILVLTPRGLLVNIEIDEPYVYETKEPIHYYESERDLFRNDSFTKSNCSVIRFSERQIMKYPNVCLDIIRRFDDETGNLNDKVLPPDFKEKAWSKKEAIKMANENIRDSY